VKARALSRRTIVGLSDAGLSSLGNLSLTWVGARFLDLEQFGLLSTIVFAGLIAAGLSKAALIDGYTLLHSTAERRRADAGTRRVLGAVLIVALVSAGLAVVVAAMASVAFGLSALLIALGPLLVPILVQDGFRWLCFANADEKLALVSTGVWTIGIWIACGLLVALDAVALPALVLTWSCFAGVGALVAMAAARTWPLPRGAARWWREARSIGSRSSVDFLLTQSVSMGGGLVVAAAAGSAAFGLVRLAQLPLAPVQVLVMGSIALVQPTMVVRVRDGQKKSAFDVGLAVCILLSAVTVVVALSTMMIPSSVMVAVLGESWPSARNLVPLVSVAMLGSVLGACFGPYLRATGLLGFEVQWKLVASPISLLLVLIGAAVWGAAGGAAALGLGALVFAVPLAVRARRSITETTSVGGR
jgi:O-antigen/teichoic acid export membrane protein